MTATAAFGFPWLYHFTVAESDRVERLREKYEDHLIATHKAIKCMGIKRTRDEVLEYLAQNPRKPKDAA